MLTDLLKQFVRLFSALLAFLFVLRAFGQLIGKPTLGPLLKPFNGWMEATLSKIRDNILHEMTGFDFSPVLAAIIILLIGHVLSWLF